MKASLIPEFPRVISSSLRGTFNRCHKRFHYETILGLQRKDTPNVHLTAGAAYAAALEATRREYFTSADFDRSVALGLEALIRTYTDFNPPEGETKTFERTVAAFTEYLVTYPLTTDPIKPSIGNNGPRVEFTFTFEIPECFHPVTGEPLLYSGAIDTMVDFNGALFTLDDKTTSSIGATWSKQWDLRSQFTGYVAGAQAHNLPVIGAIIRGMAILKTKCHSAQAIVYRPPWLVDRWKQRLTWDTQRILQCWKDSYWPHTGEESDACTHYGVCQFHDLCTSSHEQNFLSTFYEVSRWDPVARERSK